MDMDIKHGWPTEYHMEIFVDSFDSDPFIVLKSRTPFYPMSVGDLIDPMVWHGRMPYSDDQIGRVTAVKHEIAEVQDGYIFQKVKICIAIEKEQS